MVINKQTEQLQLMNTRKKLIETKGEIALTVITKAIARSIPSSLTERIPDFSMDRLEEEIYNVICKLGIMGDFVERCKQSNLYTSVYLAGVTEALTSSFVEAVRTAGKDDMEKIVATVGDIIGTKDYTRVSTEIERRLMKSLVNASIENEEAKNKDAEFAAKVQTKAAMGMANSDSATNSINAVVDDLENDNGDEEPVITTPEPESNENKEESEPEGKPEEGTSTETAGNEEDNRNFGDRDDSELVNEEDEEHVQRVTESENNVVINPTETTTYCFNVIDDLTINMEDCKNDEVACLYRSIALKATSNFLVQLGIYKQGDMCDLIKATYPIKGLVVETIYGTIGHLKSKNAMRFMKANGIIIHK